jgi:hypothetical protein
VGLLTCPCGAEQIEKDIEGAKKNLEEAEAGVVKLRKDLSKLQEQVVISEVSLPYIRALTPRISMVFIGSIL